MIKITGRDNIFWIQRLFYVFNNCIERMIDELDGEKEYVFENPKWGLETEINGKKYQLTMELKEVE